MTGRHNGKGRPNSGERWVEYELGNVLQLHRRYAPFADGSQP